MADFLYDLNKEAWMGGGSDIVDIDTDDINATLVRASTYTPDQAADDFYDTVTTPVAEASGFLSITLSGVNVDAVDFTFTAVGAGAEIDLLVIWKDTTVDGTSRVVAKYDISVTPNGNDINVSVHVSGLFDL